MAMKIKVPARTGDIVLLTPGAFSDPHGRMHWWQFEMEFRRPDGSTGMSKWLVASHKYAAKRDMNPERFEVTGDVVWQTSFTGRGGEVDSNAIRDFMAGNAAGNDNRLPNPLAMGGTPEKIAIGVALAGGLAAVVYYATRPAPSTSGPAAGPPLTVSNAVALAQAWANTRCPAPTVAELLANTKGSGITTADAQQVVANWLNPLCTVASK